MTTPPPPSRWRSTGLMLCAATLLGVGIGLWLVPRVVVTIDLEEDLPVTLKGVIPFSTRLEKRVDATIAQEVQAEAMLGESLSVQLDERLSIPIRLDIDVPIDTRIAIDDSLDVELIAHVTTTLTDKELKLEELTIPLDTEVFVDDVVHLETVVPLDTTVQSVLGIDVPVKANLPIKLDVPIKQKMRIRDTLRVKVRGLRAPLNLEIPIKATIPIKQTIRVKGNVRVPVRETLPLHINQAMIATVDKPIPVVVKLDGKLPVDIATDLVAEVELREPIATRLGKMQLSADNVTVDLR